MTQSRPDLAVPLAMERASGKHAPDRRRQRLIRHCTERPAPLRCRRRGAEMAIHARAGELPHPADRGQAVRFAGDRRHGAAHGLRLRRTKGRPASRRAIFSFSRSRSISAAPSLAFSRSLSSSSPVVARVVRAALPTARKALCQPVSIAAVTPSSRETVSRSPPRNSRSTAAVLRWRDILPPPPRAAPPPPPPPSPPRSPAPPRLPPPLPLAPQRSGALQSRTLDYPWLTSRAEIVRLRSVPINRGTGESRQSS